MAEFVFFTSLALLWIVTALYICVSSAFDFIFRKDYVVNWFSGSLDLNAGYWYKAPCLLLAIFVLSLIWPAILFYRR